MATNTSRIRLYFRIGAPQHNMVRRLAHPFKKNGFLTKSMDGIVYYFENGSQH
jgi:hypothetical protein